MTPGPIGINAATYVGFTSTGSVWGSIIATFAVVLPSFILMLTISKFFLKYQKHPIVESIFNGLRPAVVGLLRLRRVGINERRKLRFAYGRYLFIRYQYHYLSDCIHRNKKI